jgi:hypothetical protein
MKMYGGEEVQLYAFITSALYGGELLVSRLGRFISGTRWMEDWVGPRGSLDTVAKRKYPFPVPCWEWNPGRPARMLKSQ